MAIATCVLTCRSWFCMSRMTCLIIFSGCSALSTKSLRFARTSVETLSSSALMLTPYFLAFTFQSLGAVSCGWWQCIRSRRLIAYVAYLGQQLTHAHPRKRFEQCRDL